MGASTWTDRRKSCSHLPRFTYVVHCHSRGARGPMADTRICCHLRFARSDLSFVALFIILNTKFANAKFADGFADGVWGGAHQDAGGWLEGSVRPARAMLATHTLPICRLGASGVRVQLIRPLANVCPVLTLL